MSMRPGEPDGPLVPMPAVTREALREAVRHIRPLNVTQFDRELGEAFDQSVRTGSTGWMRGFLVKWATFVAIERWPERAAALRAAETVAESPHATDQSLREAQTEIAQLLHEAQQEIVQ
ncbi:hypothetical protein [Streptomyces iconiensis]|uniref:Uncharacterized protein n=1 Tax=Streptomyces iconiensis TaxID=1384038 RepID=A0ABT6ZYH5_9ACTN|nr:hypothetical protein [Streptomyces iconiensis]MDJ1134122.1 hypothetical protein [Streptomyces iconiensis]